MKEKFSDGNEKKSSTVEAETKLFAALNDLERHREAFHETLGTARMSFMDARLALRERAIDLSLDTVPVADLKASFKLFVATSPAEVEVAVDLKKDKSASGLGTGVLDSAEKEAKLGEKNPVHWFTLCPPRDLVRAQMDFKRTLQLAAALAKAQLHVVELLEGKS